MLNSFLQIISINPVAKSSAPVAGLYMFVFVAIIYAVVKLSNDNYISGLIATIGLDKKKFEAKGNSFNFSKSSLFMQLSVVLLISIGLSIISYEYQGSYNLAKIVLGVFGFYIIQIAGFVVFASIINSKESSFLHQRLSYYELLGLILFPVILISYYSPIPLVTVVLTIMLASWFLVLTRVSIYLTSLISVFHIILYLCTLEIIPILFLLKFIFN